MKRGATNRIKRVRLSGTGSWRLRCWIVSALSYFTVIFIGGTVVFFVVFAFHPWLGLPRVLEYSSNSRVVSYSSIFYTRVVVTFYFRFQISISGCSFFASSWWIVEIYWNLGLRDFICNLPAMGVSTRSTCSSLARTEENKSNIPCKIRG